MHKLNSKKKKKAVSVLLDWDKLCLYAQNLEPDVPLALSIFFFRYLYYSYTKNE